MKLGRWIVAALLVSATSISAQSVSELFNRPAVMGDSLSQGFYGVTVEKKTQNWAYPVVVSKQAGSNVYYNELKGPYANLEDVLKGDCGVFCLASSVLGGNEKTYSLPTHAGITGAEYTSVLRTSGKCEDIYAKKWVKDWYWKKWYWYTYRWVEVQDCQEPDKFHRFGLRDAGTQIQIMEKVKPSFVFASVGANHVLCTALSTTLDCLDEARFKRDVAEVMRRLDNIGTVKGGSVFTVPNVTSIYYLERYNDPNGRANYSGLKAFYRSGVSSPDHVLDAGEVATITNFLTMLNNELRRQAAARNYALTDAEAIFADIKENGRPIQHSSGWSPGTAGANWPLPGKPGVFGLDGVHPNRYGHTVLANELIKDINRQYGVNIPQASEYAAWYYDSLNRNPVDLKRWLSDSIVGQAISWIINIFI
ncbi:MAG TPA: hypothetical protein DEA96_07820 [Leptospiraceae bacterium]|nr:hypothetical protein [Spirochaetaceae bacterium]HBS04854.1 hypothetical protein [Leptospiraceae bacterium]|tara:strand:- start:9637 stop:10899 length:1263 start_codon:yes stop_codon:yes gene_type:complete